MTAIKSLVSRSNVQATITLVLLAFVGWGFWQGKISGEAIVGFAGLAINYFLPGKAEAK